MYAIVRTGGKQYTVREKDVIQVEKLDTAAGEKIELSEVLFLGDEKGNIVGDPIVEGAKITGKVLQHGRGKKIIGFTYKPKKRESRRYGHRQDFTQILIEKISRKKQKKQESKKEASE